MDPLPRSPAGDLAPAPPDGEPAAPDRGAEPALRPAEALARLFREGYRFDFFRAAHLLERLFPDAPPPGTTPRYRDERVRFRADAADVFPASDVKEVAWIDDRDGGPRARLTATFMGLYGTDSPLPYYFYEGVTREQPHAGPLRDFLDLFDHRLYAFFYRAWKKYRPGLGDAADAHRTRFLALAGLATPRAADAAPVDPMRLAAFAGRMGGRARTAEGLRALLDDLLGVPVEVVENVPRWVALARRPALGGLRLSDDAVLGERVRDVAGKFRLCLGPLGLDDYRAFLPGGEKAKRLDRLIALYVPDRLAFDVELLLREPELPQARLGHVRLGPMAVLGNAGTGVRAHVVAYA